MPKYPFLSDEWTAEAERIREEYKGKAGEIPAAQRMKANLIINDVPFGSGSENAHIDTTSGEMDMDKGHIDGPDVTVTLDYTTAKAIFIEGNPQAGMQAFMSGKIKIQGDMTKIMMMQSATPDPVAQEVAQKIAAITE